MITVLRINHKHKQFKADSIVLREAPTLLLGGEGFVVLPALVDDLNAIVVEDDDLEGVKSEELERHHVAASDERLRRWPNPDPGSPCRSSA